MNILCAGVLIYNGQNISYKVVEIDKSKLDITVSFVIGSTENDVVFHFDKVLENHWTLDTKQTKSDINIDFKFDKEKQIWSLGTNNLEVNSVLKNENIRLVYKSKKINKNILKSEIFEAKEKLSTPSSININQKIEIIEEKTKKLQKDRLEGELSIERNGNQLLSLDSENGFLTNEKEHGSLSLEMNLDCLINNLSNVKKYGFMNNILFTPIIKGLCEDFKRTIQEEKIQQPNSINTNHLSSNIQNLQTNNIIKTKFQDLFAKNQILKNNYSLNFSQ